MTAPVFFTVEADYKSVVADSVSDVDHDPQLGAVTATVTFTPMLATGDVILAADTLPRPTGFVAAPIVGRIDTDGRLKLRVDPDLDVEPFASVGAFPATGDPDVLYRATDTMLVYRWDGAGYVETYPFTPVRLLADTELLGLDGDLYYDVRFTNVQFNGAKGIINGFGFKAPNADEVVNLIEVGKVPGIPATSFTRGPRGWRSYVLPITEGPDAGLYQWHDELGEPFGPPVTLYDVISEAIAEAAASAAAQAVTPGIVTTDLAGRDLDVELSGSDVQFTLGGDALGAPLDLNVTLPMADPSSVVTSTYSASPNELVPADATSGPFTVNLPDAPPNFSLVVVKKVDDTSNVVTVQRSGTDVFNKAGGPTSAQLVAPDQSLWLQYKSGIWYVFGHGTPLASLDDRYFLRGNSIPAPNGLTAIQIDSVTNAENYWRVVPSVAGGVLLLRAAGSDANISQGLRPKGTGNVLIYESGGTIVATFANDTTPVNRFQFVASAAGQPLRIVAQGNDTTLGVNVVTKNKAPLQVNGVDVATRGVIALTSSSSLTPDVDTADVFVRSALAANLTINAPSGTPLDGKVYTFRFKDNGTTKTLTWNAIYRAIGVSIPTATVGGKTLYVICRYNAADTKMDVIDVKQEA